MATGIALLQMSTQGRGTTIGDVTHHLLLRRRRLMEPSIVFRVRLQNVGDLEARPRDRKSTRLNSSHRCISYAVFCLKKKIKLLRRYALRLEYRSERLRDQPRGQKERDVLHQLLHPVVLLVGGYQHTIPAEGLLDSVG